MTGKQNTPKKVKFQKKNWGGFCFWPFLPGPEPLCSVSTVFNQCLISVSKVFQKCFENDSKVFVSFSVLKLFVSIEVIAATQALGGLVL